MDENQTLYKIPLATLFAMAKKIARANKQSNKSILPGAARYIATEKQRIFGITNLKRL
jgi:hypothetical protein